MRFLHTADWQLGMTRHFLSPESQARYTDARFEAIRTIGRIAVEEAAEFVVVCGDVFETNQVDRRTVVRTLDLLGSIHVPVLLLPGNHDPLDAASVYQCRVFREKKPANVHVLESCEPCEPVPGVEVIGAPWTSKRPLSDLCAGITSRLAPARGKLRVLIGHGAVDSISPQRDDLALIGLSAAEAALADGRIHFLALGDHHSKAAVGSSGRIWYAGTPEPTRYEEQTPGYALIVDLAHDHVSVTERLVAKWRFLVKHFGLSSDADLDALENELALIERKDSTILKLALVGTLSLAQKARLDSILDHARDLFAAIEFWERHSELAILAESRDFEDLDLSGFGKTTLERLRARADLGGDDGEAARDALALLVRVARRDR